MNKVAFVILCCIWSLFTYGQKSKDYVLYFKRMNAIDSLNAMEQMDSSLLLYTHVIHDYGRLMARDAYNACQIAALRKRIDFGLFVHACGVSGVPEEKLLANKIIHVMYEMDSALWSSSYKKGWKEYIHRIDCDLRTEMINRARAEQLSKGKDNYVQVCADNFTRVIELTAQGRFPGECLVGVNEELECIMQPTFCHFPYSFLKLQPYLQQIISSGDWSPMAAFYVYGFNQTRKSILYTENIPDEGRQFQKAYNLPFGSRSNEIEEVNGNRRAAMLIPVEVEMALKNFRRKYGLDYLIY